MACGHKAPGGGDKSGCRGYGKSTNSSGSPRLTGYIRKNTGCHERGHGVTKQRAWRESAEQHGAAWRSGPANEGPRTHEDGGARGAPRWRAVLQPTGRIGEWGPTMGQRSKRLTIPLHKASRLSGGYVECSPRRGCPRSGLEDCHGEVDVLLEPIVERTAHCEQEVVGHGGRTHPRCGTQPLETQEERERQCAPYGWSRAEKGAAMARDESRGDATITTYHDWLRAWQCV